MLCSALLLQHFLFFFKWFLSYCMHDVDWGEVKVCLVFSFLKFVRRIVRVLRIDTPLEAYRHWEINQNESKKSILKKVHVETKHWNRKNNNSNANTTTKIEGQVRTNNEFIAASFFFRFGLYFATIHNIKPYKLRNIVRERIEVEFRSWLSDSDMPGLACAHI